MKRYRYAKHEYEFTQQCTSCVLSLAKLAHCWWCFALRQA